MEPRCICFPLSSQEALWDALKSRDIDLVISDHSPCTEDLKLMDRGDFMAAWGGISGVQYGECLYCTYILFNGQDVPRLIPISFFRVIHILVAGV